MSKMKDAKISFEVVSEKGYPNSVVIHLTSASYMGMLINPCRTNTTCGHSSLLSDCLLENIINVYVTGVYRSWCRTGDVYSIIVTR